MMKRIRMYTEYWLINIAGLWNIFDIIIIMIMLLPIWQTNNIISVWYASCYDCLYYRNSLSFSLITFWNEYQLQGSQTFEIKILLCFNERLRNPCTVV